MKKYKIQSYELQDGKWGSAYQPSMIASDDSIIITEPFEFNKYFDLKEEADQFTLNYLLNEKGIKELDIEIL